MGELGRLLVEPHCQTTSHTFEPENHLNDDNEEAKESVKSSARDMLQYHISCFRCYLCQKILQDGMNFGFSSFNQPFCEDHVQQSTEDDSHDEENPKAETFETRGGSVGEEEESVESKRQEKCCRVKGGKKTKDREGDGIYNDDDDVHVDNGDDKDEEKDEDRCRLIQGVSRGPKKAAKTIHQLEILKSMFEQRSSSSASSADL